VLGERLPGLAIENDDVVGPCGQPLAGLIDRVTFPLPLAGSSS